MRFDVLLMMLPRVSAGAEHGLSDGLGANGSPSQRQRRLEAHEWSSLFVRARPFWFAQA